MGYMMTFEPDKQPSEAVKLVMDIIEEKGWSSGEESWGYGEEGWSAYYAELDSDFHIRPVAEEIVEKLQKLQNPGSSPSLANGT